MKISEMNIVRTTLRSRPRGRRAVGACCAVCGLCLIALLGGATPAEERKEQTDQSTPAPDPEFEAHSAVARPPFSEDIFPCSDCHDPEIGFDPTRREVEDHPDIVFEHDAANRWCLDCHDAENRDKLRLADGRLVDFTESQRLCGQCHGPKLRDWRAGEHGKRTGSWSGKKEYLLCVHCHDPHSPSIKPVVPERAPLRQEDLR